MAQAVVALISDPSVAFGDTYGDRMSGSKIEPQDGWPSTSTVHRSSLQDASGSPVQKRLTWRVNGVE